MTDVDKSVLKACVEWWKVKSKIEVFDLMIKKVSNVFYQFPFPIQYFANFWIIQNALRSVSCSTYT